MNKWNWSILFSWRSILYFHEGVFLGYASLGCLTGTHSQWTQYITPKGGPRSGFQVCSSSYDSPPNRHSETWRQGYLHIYAGQLQRKHLIDGDDGHVKVFVTDGSRQTVTSFVSMYYSWMLHAHESVHGISERLKQTFVFFLLSVASR